jgi:hypothetical protein
MICVAWIKDNLCTHTCSGFCALLGYIHPFLNCSTLRSQVSMRVSPIRRCSVYSRGPPGYEPKESAGWTNERPALGPIGLENAATADAKTGRVATAILTRGPDNHVLKGGGEGWDWPRTVCPVVLETARGSGRRLGLVLPEGRGAGLAVLGVAGRKGDGIGILRSFQTTMSIHKKHMVRTTSCRSRSRSGEGEEGAGHAAEGPG